VSAARHPKAVVLSRTVNANEGQAGASARREYERRKRAREQQARDKWGALGVLVSKLIDEPQSTRAWKQGGHGEEETARRLDRHLHEHGVLLLHDRRIPGHGNANIDHLAVGPGGVTVIDSKAHRGRVQVQRVGRMFSRRRSMLLIAGRDQTKLIDGVERQIGYVRKALAEIERGTIDVRGALCFPHPDGLPVVSHLTVRDIRIDAPRPVAKLARRPGALDADEVGVIWNYLGRRFPSA
jgi:hypothetical protein